ncbi:MAG: hypothetical protein WCL44_02200 [bacterium]
MISLSTVSLAAGLALAILSAPALLFPDLARKWCGAFPRNTAAAWVLTAIDLAWAATLLYSSPMLAGVEWARRLCLVLAPVAFFLIVFFIDELLAARALGGLLVLVPRPVLDAAFINTSDWKLVMTALSYIVVVAGIVLILSPFRFRQVTGIVMKTNGRSRLAGAMGLSTGILVLVLALTVYRTVNT